MSNGEIERITSIAGVFSRNTTITTFDELENFTGLTSIASVAGSGLGAFQQCTSLESVKLGDNITSIGGSAFSNCTALNSINIPSTVTSIGSAAFASVPAPMVLDCPELTTIGDRAFDSSGITRIDNLGKITRFTSNDGSGRGAFYLCKNLTSVVFPTTLKTISSNTFAGCSSLVIDELRLPNLETISDNAFSGVVIKK